MVSTHAVVAGETLSALALRFYGDAELYRLIAAASGIADPDVVNVGQRLIMPDFTRYTVVAGDTLSALAARFYGDASLISAYRRRQWHRRSWRHRRRAGTGHIHRA